MQQDGLSHFVRVRGLKQIFLMAIAYPEAVAPMQVRELKHPLKILSVKSILVAPVRVRGLKQMDWPVGTGTTAVASRTGA